jgi:hypothetical protein
MMDYEKVRLMDCKTFPVRKNKEDCSFNNDKKDKGGE